MSILALFALILTGWFVVLGLGLIFNNKMMCQRVMEVADEDELMWTWGFWALAFGLAIIALTGYTITWTGYACVLPLAGWLGALKGIWLIWAPGTPGKLMKRYCQPGGMSMFGGIILALLGGFFWQAIIPMY